MLGIKFLIMKDSIYIAYLIYKKVKQVYLKHTAFHQKKTEHIYRTWFEREENNSSTFAGSSA